MQNCELLSRGLFNDCVQFASDEGDLRLSALIYAASGSNTVRDILRHCAHEDVKRKFEFERKLLFVLFEIRLLMFIRMIFNEQLRFYRENLLSKDRI